MSWVNDPASVLGIPAGAAMLAFPAMIGSLIWTVVRGVI
jgi:hypothetical protein